jgi:hypothetical protein
MSEKLIDYKNPDFDKYIVTEYGRIFYMIDYMENKVSLKLREESEEKFYKKLDEFYEEQRKIEIEHAEFERMYHNEQKEKEQEQKEQEQVYSNDNEEYVSDDTEYVLAVQNITD